MELLSAYWSHAALVTNGVILLHLLGAALTGLLLGYERTYHGRAAGMRTYALVCVASTMLTVIIGYPAQWYGSAGGPHVAPDPSHVIQGIMTGIGFLGAGVIMKEGFTIRGLSTAASIWATAAIGVVIGVGFYAAALFASLIVLLSMVGLGRLERLLPHQTTLHLSLVFRCDQAPSPDQISSRMLRHGFDVVDWSFNYSEGKKQYQYDLVLVASGACQSHGLAGDLSGVDEVIEFHLSPARA